MYSDPGKAFVYCVENGDELVQAADVELSPASGPGDQGEPSEVVQPELTCWGERGSRLPGTSEHPSVGDHPPLTIGEP